MTLIDHDQDLDLERRDVRDVRDIWGLQARIAAGDPQCECPDFCPVQHDNDN